MLFNVFSLVSTWHALGFSVFLMVDTLTSIRCHLRAIESRLNALFSTVGTIKCSVNAMVQIGKLLRVGF